MLAKLALRYHSLTFVVAKINVYWYTWEVVCHVVGEVENGVLPVQLVAERKIVVPFAASCDDPCTSTSAENRFVEQVRAKERRKRGKYNHYYAEVRAKIAKHACEYGNKPASVKFTQELGHYMSESSVRNMKKAHFLKLKSVLDPADINSLPHAALGRPLPVRGELDADIAEYVRAPRLAGGIVNRAKFNGC